MVKQDGLNIKFLHDCLLIKDILVIGDLHFGYEEQFNGGSVLPGRQLKEITEKLDEIFNYLENEKIKVKKIVLLGDVKHDFGTITDIEWRETLEFFNYLKEKLEDSDKDSNKTNNKIMIEDSNMDLANNQALAKISKGYKNNKDKLKNKIIVIKGNHDNILQPILKKLGIKLRNYYCVNIKSNKKDRGFGLLGGEKKDKLGVRGLGWLQEKIKKRGNNKNKEFKICFLHGDRLFKQCLDSQTDVLVFGHLHPSIALYDKYKSEKYKCFLRGKWKINGEKEVYILPNFGSYSLGYDLRDIDNINEREGILKRFSKLKDKSNNIKRGKSKLKKTNRSKDGFFVVPNNILKNFEVIIYNNKEKKEYGFGEFNRLLKKYN